MDTRTVIIVMISQISLLGVLAIVYGARSDGMRASSWGFGLLLVGTGFAGLALRGVLPNLLSVTVANTVLVGGFLLFYRSVRTLTGRPLADPLGVAAFAGTAVYVFVFSEVTPNLQARIVGVAAVGAVLFARNALELRRDVPAEVRASHVFMQAVYWIVAVLLAARCVVNLVQPSNGLLEPSVPQSAFFLGALLLVTAGTFGNFWIEAQHLHLQLARQASRDALTGMLNRGALFDALERELARARRSGAAFSVAMFDLDHFKALNDTYGHPAGDEVLRKVAATMQGCVRQPDILGRYGGEEFVLLMPDTDAEMAMTVADRIRVAVKSNGVPWEGRFLAIAVSGGVANFPSHGITPDTLIAAADAALYEAKHAGRDRVLRAVRSATEDVPRGIHAT